MHAGITYFVTGASGFIGGDVCRALVNAGQSVRVLIRRPDVELSRLSLDVRYGDLCDEEELHSALVGVSVVIHCAGNARFGNGRDYDSSNVGLTEKIIAATRLYARANCRLIYISSIGAQDRSRGDTCSEPITELSPCAPSSDYGRSKLQAEAVVMESGLRATIIRPAMVVGDRMRPDSHFAVFARQALSNSMLGRIAWSASLSVIHVSDLTQAILFISQNSLTVGEIYICAGDPVSLGGYFVQCSPGRFRIPVAPVAIVARTIPRIFPFSLKVMLLSALVASDAKLRAMGWQPTYSSEAALAGVIHRERARLNPTYSPGGQTVITGAASGLGRALVVFLASKREHMLLVDRDAESLLALVREYDNCDSLTVDLSNSSQLDALTSSDPWNRFPITELYNCAGIGARGRMQELALSYHRDVIAVNIMARITLTQSAVKRMQKRHFGRVVMISSSSAFQPLPFMASYAATNSAVLSLGEAWAAEVDADGVQITTVCPGGMRTNFQKSSGVKEIKGEHLMSPEAVVAEMFERLGHSKRTIIISKRSKLMALLARILPRSVTIRLWYKLMERMR